MDKDSSDFMIEEYDKIATAYFGLQIQLTEWFKTYITLVGLPLTILAAVYGSLQLPLPSLDSLPDLVSVLLIVVGILGFFVTLTIINMRMEMLLYARTINGVRRYFAEMDLNKKDNEPSKKLHEFLILPTSDKYPLFFEKYRAVFWQVIIIGLLDGCLWIVSIKSLLPLSWFWSVIIGLVFGFLHYWSYWKFANSREKEWKTTFESNLGEIHL